MTILEQAKNVLLRKKVTVRDANEDSTTVCIKVQNTSDNAGGKHTVRNFTLRSTQNI